MKTLRALTICIGCLLATAAPASASVEIGQTFAPAQATALVVFQADSDPATGAASYYVPYTQGVITSWRHQADAAGGSLKLKVVRFAGATNTFYTVGQSNIETLVPSVNNTFQTRIPVAGGDLLGLKATASIKLLKGLASPVGAPDNQIGAYSLGSDPTPGSTDVIAGGINNFVLDVAATVEPDGDGDGYGDDTQDQCPSSAANPGGPCPPPPDRAAPSLSGAKAFKLSKLLKKSVIEVSVITNEAATATGTGTITVPGAKPYTLKQASVSVPAGGRATLKFKVPKKALKTLRKKGRAKSQIDISVTDAAGNASKAEFPSKLKIIKTHKVIRR